MKTIIYQVLVRLFGNTNTKNIPYGSRQENGIGKFSDFTYEALQGIKELGVTHIWLTGVLHHALVGDYTYLGIPNDFPYLVKGRAGSPYAIKDFYNVDPDLAENPINRLEEFASLVERIHHCGMKVIIDIVPNHIARQYFTLSKRKGVKNFEEDDDATVTYARDNNFYYNIGERLCLPTLSLGYTPTEPALRELSETPYVEYPAKWTGNSCSSAPEITDWYETVKLNYGITPEGKKDFDTLPSEFAQWDYGTHYAFWRSKIVPDTWLKFKDIVAFWLGFGIDGFRYDMAEMVPVEFWSYLNSFIKTKKPDSFLIAEVYNPNLYHDYLFMGKMDALYDKVGLYDTLRNIICYEQTTDSIDIAEQAVKDIAPQMLHFLENHDEQRIASDAFASDAFRGLPAMTVSTYLSDASVMLYFGQEVGERAEQHAGFGSPSRTSIFDYIGVPAHQRWVNNKKYDGGALSSTEKILRDFYKRLLHLPVKGIFKNIHHYNRIHTPYYNDKVYSFVREEERRKWIIIVNFSRTEIFGFDLQIPPILLQSWQLSQKDIPLTEELYHKEQTLFHKEQGKMRIDIAPLQSLIFSIETVS